MKRKTDIIHKQAKLPVYGVIVTEKLLYVISSMRV
ncbi:hypothetical protein ME9_01508 [Bartonella taylorii 8TBB]|uniref:Uncharacterized protein n=1 Tax=Bartonella taylorii 8TBB TaxID=1094560 RepID=A0A9P2RY98_BARTA|nr:hypothetical protein ME9_01508 [Bartonella taylorii 8TBB]OPB34849.1 hypothetical protein Btaycd_011000 [Bartonella taylorii]